MRDPYSRQTRLTLTQMIRKLAAENKQIRAELKRAQVKKGGENRGSGEVPVVHFFDSILLVFAVLESLA